jgi:hypothetical protein
MTSHARVDEILSRFPGPIILYPSRTKWLLVLLGCAAFAAIGFWMIASENVFGWLLLLFFGTGAGLAFVALLPGASALKLDRRAFEITSLFRRYPVSWQAVSNFEALPIATSGIKVVLFDNADEGHRVISNLNVAVSGHNAGLPDTYGMSAEELASLMVRWRESAVFQAVV